MKWRGFQLRRGSGRVALIVLLAAWSAGLAACAAPASAVTGAKPQASTAAPAAADAGASGDSIFVYGFGPDGAGVFELDGASGKIVRSLPGGFVAPDWSTLYTAAFLLDRTELRAYDMNSGKLLRETSLPGRYDVVASPDAPQQSAFSPDGRTLVLFKQPSDPEHDAELKQWEATGKPRTRIALVDTSFKTPPHFIDLDGNFWFDAMGNRALYLLEILDKGFPPNYSPTQTPRYNVRRYDVAADRLDPQPVVDKSDPEIMTGNRGASAALSGGTWLFSVYTRVTEGPFVHILNMDDAYAVCLDLPFPAGNYEESMAWGMALSPDERTLYAVNVQLGQVAAIDTQSFEMRTATLPAPQAEAPGLLTRLADWLVPRAEAKSLYRAAAAVSPDGKTLYAIGLRDVVALSTQDLSLQGRYMDGMLFTGLAVAPDGGALYGVTMENGELVKLDLRKGGPAVALHAPVTVGGLLRATEGER